MQQPKHRRHRFNAKARMTHRHAFAATVLTFLSVIVLDVYPTHPEHPDYNFFWEFAVVYLAWAIGLSFIYANLELRRESKAKK